MAQQSKALGSGPRDRRCESAHPDMTLGQPTNWRVVESPQGAWLKVNGRRVLNFCSNNYLGLCADRRVIAAANRAAPKYGVGAGAVRALSGNSIVHMKLEQALARFKQVEAALFLQSGFIANLAAIQTLLHKEDIVISDALNHASIIDAIRLTGIVNKFVYAHGDPADLERHLIEAKKIQAAPRSDGAARQILVVTDGVFSMDGDLAPLPEIVKLAKKFGALLMVDDAHGEGVMGPGGRGTIDHFGLRGQIDIEVGTFSKAFGVVGGFITGSQERIAFYRQHARPYLFSCGLSIPDAAAITESIKIVSRSRAAVKRLWTNARYLQVGFQKLGFKLTPTQTPITPVLFGPEDLAEAFSRQLYALEVFATPVKFPMVARGAARIRVMPSALHTKGDLDFGLAAFAKAGKKLSGL